MKPILNLLIIILTFSAFSQKKILDHKDVNEWNTINNKSISPNGKYIMYSLEKGELDNFLKIKDSKAKTVFEYERAEKGQFSFDSKNAFFTIKPWNDEIKKLKRKKVKKDKLPKDSLGIYNLNDNSLVKIANVKSYKIPTKWSGFVAYLLEKMSTTKNDSINDDIKSKKSGKKKEDKKDYNLVLRNLRTSEQDTIKHVSDFIFAKESKQLSYTIRGKDDKGNGGVYVLDLERDSLTKVYSAGKAEYHKLTFTEDGKKLAFVVDADTTKTQIRPNELYIWEKGLEKAKKILDNKTSPEGFLVSADGKIEFSKDNTKLYFGLAKPPIIKDTTLIDEEIVNVEVWTFDEPRLYTVQEMDMEKDQKKSYRTVFHINSNNIIQLGDEDYPNVEIGNEGNASIALANNPKPYRLKSQWEGRTARDYALVNIENGGLNKIFTGVYGRMRLSPNGNYAYGYDFKEKAWFSYSIASQKMVNLTKENVFFDELNDRPDYPNSYRSAGWTKNDESIILYDRYDIWEYYPETGKGKRLTKGRENKIVYRVLKLDDEERFLDKNKNWLLSKFSETDKSSGYVEYNPQEHKVKELIHGDYKYSKPIKAKTSDMVIYTRESFKEFPDVLFSNLSFKKSRKISNANPQQNNFNWGTIELYKWTSLDGTELSGLLIKPEDFDPAKKYPMIVNFYERNSDRLHTHRRPANGRSSINYSFYASRGYVIFNPDIFYRIGYPGESAYNCVIPGVTSLIEKGFIDKNNIGVQGHSWGGYQIAYLVTKTSIFKAAEAGAPVPNMISAYGGIRWATGLSRQFQYEHTQSRIGGTPWEFPQRYIENSPIFNIDKINTPLLIMANDKDGHVPWYQGIEFFNALRRLGKHSWLLNYNDEPHWPLKLQNRKDFNIRLAQFFDYYLKDSPKPIWMERGVPAIEKGINQGLELISN